MFNGIIFNHGVVNKIDKRAKGINLFIMPWLNIIPLNILKIPY